MQPNFIPSFPINTRRPTPTSIHAVWGISIQKEGIKMHILGNEEKKEKDTLDQGWDTMAPLWPEFVGFNLESALKSTSHKEVFSWFKLTIWRLHPCSFLGSVKFAIPFFYDTCLLPRLVNEAGVSRLSNIQGLIVLNFWDQPRSSGCRM